MFTFELICMILEGYLKNFTLSGFFGFLKILKFLDFQLTLSLRRQLFSAHSACAGNFLAQAQPAQANCQRRLSLRKYFPCFVRFFLAHAQPAQAIFQRRFSLRRQIFSAGSACVKKQNCEYLPWSSKHFFFSSPQVTYLTGYLYSIGFVGVKKWVKTLTLGHL